LYPVCVLPDVYERWFQELCGRPSPVETRANCDRCNMLDPAEEEPFNPETRCCTYHPHLAPHLVGALIAEGSRIVEEKVAARDGVTPLGLGPNAAYSALFARLGQTPDAFGRQRALLCPFYAQGHCSIWAQRPMACAAFFCKFDRGPLGHGVWKLMVVSFHAVDHALLKRLVAHAGLDAAACDALLRTPADRELEARAWGSWRGREREYFLEAARLAAEARPSEFPELARLGEALRGVLARLDARPEKVRRNQEVLYQLGRVRHTGVPFDRLEVDLEQLDFERLDEETRRRLVDWQVLLPCEP
jgi:Fe-S-cluster containining protein